MPCGGIWRPEPGSHWLKGGCYVCDEDGCELFCDEWDAPLHRKCLGVFLASKDGEVVLRHGHAIDVPELARENDAPKPGLHASRKAKTETTRDAMAAMRSSERLAYYIAYGRWLAAQIAAKEGTVHSRELHEEMTREGVLDGYRGGDFWLGAVFNKNPAFEQVPGRTHTYSTDKVHERTIKVWRLAEGVDPATVERPPTPEWLKEAWARRRGGTP